MRAIHKIWTASATAIALMVFTAGSTTSGAWAQAVAETEALKASLQADIEGIKESLRYGQQFESYVRTATEEHREKWKAAAASGIPEGCYLYGSCLIYGIGVEVDTSEGLDLIRKAAEEGIAVAQMHLALRYRTGFGVPQDYAEAARWCRKAADLGDAIAQLLLAELYKDGLGVPQDDAEAVGWYRMAAEQRLAPAQLSLAHMYFRGAGVSRDEAEAVKWARDAAEQGLSDAQGFLGFLYTEVQHNPVEAVRWYRSAAEQGDGYSLTRLGQAYLRGAGVLQDDITGVMYILLGAERGDVVAMLVMPSLRDEYSDQTFAAARDMALKWNLEHQESGDPKGTSAGFERPRKPDELQNSGTGFLISTNGYVLTCNHVVAGASRIAVAFDGKVYDAELIRRDAGNDIALLQIEASDFLPIPIQAQGGAVGAKAFTIGYPNPDLQGMEAKYTEGVISSETGPDDDFRFYQISVPLQPGNSGGPLLDASGNVIGLVVAKMDAFAALQHCSSREVSPRTSTMRLR